MVRSRCNKMLKKFSLNVRLVPFRTFLTLYRPNKWLALIGLRLADSFFQAHDLKSESSWRYMCLI